MKEVIYFVSTAFILPIVGNAQLKDTLFSRKDSLPDVVVQSFNYNKKWAEVPATIGVLNNTQLQKIGTTCLLPAMNTIPGVRMEERSPESYRLSIRGSLLRSPFGVRDVKVYWNNLPLTDGGGNTYLNLLDNTQINSVEVAKGPAASMYGASSGGMVLLQDNVEFSNKPTNKYLVNVNGGSYGMLQEGLSWKYQNKDFSSNVLQSHQECDGYRQQSASHKDNITWTGAFKLKNQAITFSTFYTRLHYETPGGITLAQLQKDPTQARLAGGGLPSAIQQKAAIDNNAFFVGFNDVYTINKSFSTETSIVFEHTSFYNPFITNYETRDETNGGINSKLIYKHQLKKIQLQWITGGEFIGIHSRIEDDGNLDGARDTVQFKDNIYSGQWYIFSQVQLSKGRWLLQAGISANNELFSYKRLTDGSKDYTHKNTDVVAMPRLSLGYKTSNTTSLYVVVAEGFSPPSLAEIRPSSRVFNNTLQAQYGWNEEIGFKGRLLEGNLLFDFSAYRFRLQNAIVSRNNPDGTQYFVNAGNTKQDGIEGLLQYQLLKNPVGIFKSVSISESYSYQPYRFITYQQGTSNYAGNKLTGVPENVSVSGVSIVLNEGYFITLNYNQTSAIPLSDANDAYANAYHLLQGKMGWTGRLGATNIQLYVGGDNLLNEVYSLGNDINAAGKRYYNAAPRINFYGGCKISW